MMEHAEGDRAMANALNAGALALQEVVDERWPSPTPGDAVRRLQGRAR